MYYCHQKLASNNCDGYRNKRYVNSIPVVIWISVDRLVLFVSSFDRITILTVPSTNESFHLPILTQNSCRQGNISSIESVHDVPLNIPIHCQ